MENFECTDNPQGPRQRAMANPVFQNRHKKLYYMSRAIPKISKICELAFFAKL